MYKGNEPKGKYRIVFGIYDGRHKYDYEGHKSSQVFFGVKLSQKGIELIDELKNKQIKRNQNKPQTEGDFIINRNASRHKKQDEIHWKLYQKKAEELGIDNPRLLDAIVHNAEHLLREIAWNMPIEEKGKRPMTNEQFYELTKELTSILVKFYKDKLEHLYK